MGLDIERSSKLDGWDIYLWRPVMVKKALKWELDTVYTLDDLCVFHELQDIEEALSQEAIQSRVEQ